MNPKMINQGRTAEVFEIGNQQILKLFRKDFPEQSIDKEHFVAGKINYCGVPAPRLFGKTERDGRIGLIYEYIQGFSMMGLMMRKPWNILRFARQMAEIHSEIHRKNADGLPRQKEQLEFFIEKAEQLSIDERSRIIEVLRGLGDGTNLCHGDFHPDNILLTSSGEPYVIDWMTATGGNPAGDVARTVVILKFSKAPSHLPFLVRCVLNQVKSLFYSVYLRHYLKLSDIDRREISLWELPVAAARLFENGPYQEKQALLKFIRHELKHHSNDCA